MTILTGNGPAKIWKCQAPMFQGTRCAAAAAVHSQNWRLGRTHADVQPEHRHSQEVRQPSISPVAANDPRTSATALGLSAMLASQQHVPFFNNNPLKDKVRINPRSQDTREPWDSMSKRCPERRPSALHRNMRCRSKHLLHCRRELGPKQKSS